MVNLVLLLVVSLAIPSPSLTRSHEDGFDSVGYKDGWQGYEFDRHKGSHAARSFAPRAQVLAAVQKVGTPSYAATPKPNGNSSDSLADGGPCH
jgi:hypothetical protein